MAACKLRAAQHAPDQCAWVVNAGRLRAQHARGSVTSNGLAWLGTARHGLDATIFKYRKDVFLERVVVG